jgi:hypothetical protein
MATPVRDLDDSEGRSARREAIVMAYLENPNPAEVARVLRTNERHVRRVVKQHEDRLEELRHERELEARERSREKEIERVRLAEESEKRRREQDAEKVRLWEAARNEGARLKRAADMASHRMKSKDARDRKARATRTQSKMVRFSPSLEPRLDADDRAWPLHAEENARYLEAAQQNAIEDLDEYMKERQLLESNEADRIQMEAAEVKRREAIQANAARKASPPRIQSRD